MLTAVPPPAPLTSWVQVLGRVAVHVDGEAQRLTGSGQRLLAVLVAAGSDGTTAERIAEEIWGAQQPDPWRPALRMAVARLRKRLPRSWDVVADGGSYRITTGDGWIDAWRLEQAASTRTFIIEEDLGWMLAGQPFGDIDLLEMVGASTQNLKMLQIAVAERFCAQELAAVTTATCSSLVSLMRDHPYNDRLAIVVARALSHAGRGNEALHALTAFANTFAADFGEVPGDIERFLSTGGQDDGPNSGAETSTAAPVVRGEIAKELRHHTESQLLGRVVELEALQSSRGALVTGATGAGKTRLLAALIANDPTTETTYIVGDDRLDLPLGPFAVAMPTLRDELLASVNEELSATVDDRPAQPAASTRAWRIVLAYLEEQAATQPQRLVVDDAHVLDSASLGLLRLLIRSNTHADVTFVVCGRNDFDDVAWLDFSRDAERAGLDLIELDGLEVDELELMVFQQFPDATLQARQGLALEVHEASGGLPAVAAPLIASVDPETLALPEQLAGVPALARLTTALSDGASEVVAGAAVLGHQFSVGALISLTELDETSIFRVLDELWSTGLIIETDDPDQVRFRHVLIQRAFLDGVPLFRRGQLHRRAAELTDDTHERADHQANASGLVPAPVVAASLLASARLYAERRQWRKVARELRRVDDLPGDHLDTYAHTLWASALDQSGADGAAHRRVAYDLAVSSEDWQAALNASLAGLPEAEKPDGDQERIEMLRSIPAAQLSQRQRFDRVFNLCRQFSLLGDDDEVVNFANEALAIASDPDEVGMAHVLRWTAMRHHHLDLQPIPADLATAGSLRVRVRIAQINAIMSVEEGNFAAARVEAEEFKALAIEQGDPLRIWQARGLEGLFLLNDGDFDGAESIALANMKFAELHDLQQGTATFFGFQVFSYDCQDRLAELQPQLEPFRANLSGMILGRTALVMCADAVGGASITSEVRSIVSETSRRQAGTIPLLTALCLARFLPEHAPDLVAPTRRLLEFFGDKPVLASFGGASFGPTTRYVAQLSSDVSEKAALIAASIKAADQHGPLLWRVRTRLDNAALGSPAALAEAVQLAEGTGLEDLVARHTARY